MDKRWLQTGRLTVATTLIAKSAFTLAFMALAAAAAVALAFMMDGLLMTYVGMTPGAYVWKLLHPDPESASLGSMLNTMLGVDSTFWFVVLCVAGWWLKQKPRRDKGSSEGKYDIPVRFWVFCACLLLLLGLQVWGRIQSEHQSANMLAAHQRAIAEAPPVVDAPTFKFLRPEQALIVQEIAGLYPWLPGSNLSAQTTHFMPTVMRYSVGYTTTKNPGPEVRRVVAVEVTEFPNAEWARYHVKYPQLSYGLGAAQSVKRVQKFGQTVVQGGGRCFLWPHETFVVSVCYDTPQVNEEFIREYLMKYPSSL
jgi:hypothetical protein